jgi:hypothetical protein
LSIIYFLKKKKFFSNGGLVMKLYIVADMEGIAGVVSAEQTQGNSAYFDAAKLQYTRKM